MKKKKDLTPDLTVAQSAENIEHRTSNIEHRTGDPSISHLPSSQPVEYQPENCAEPWRVERFADLAVEFDLTDADLIAFHRIASLQTRPWLFVRQRFGIMPSLAPMDADPDEWRVFSVAEICARHGLETKQLRAEFDSLRGIWEQSRSGRADQQVSPKADQQVSPTTLFSDDEILLRHGFTDEFFSDEKRTTETRRVERARLAARLREFEEKRYLEEGVGRPLALNLLTTEFHLRRDRAE